MGKRLRQLREQAGLSRAQLSRLSGVDPGTLARLERGQDVRLSSYLGVIDYFLQRDPEAWMAADRFVALGARKRAVLTRGWLGVEESGDD